MNTMSCYTDKDLILNIILHGASEGIHSEFIQKIIETLEAKNLPFVAVEFSYIKKKERPSENKKRESKELIGLIKDIKKKHSYRKIRLIGKSMGGMISLTSYSEICKIIKIEEIIILGFPARLGSTVDLTKLGTDPIKPRLDFINNIQKVLNKVKCKVIVIQGLEDKLGTKDDIDTIFENKINKEVHYIPNSTHSLLPLKNIGAQEENWVDIFSALFHS